MGAEAIMLEPESRVIFSSRVSLAMVSLILFYNAAWADESEGAWATVGTAKIKTGSKADIMSRQWLLRGRVELGYMEGPLKAMLRLCGSGLRN
jgi:hypothetical protein